METLNFVRVATKAKDNADGFLYIHNWATGWQELIFQTKEEAALWVKNLCYKNNNGATAPLEYGMNVNELTNVTIGGICTADYPDFVDAYIESADDANGNPLSDEQLEVLTNDNPEFVQAQAHDEIMGWV